MQKVRKSEFRRMRKMTVRGGCNWILTAEKCAGRSRGRILGTLGIARSVFIMKKPSSMRAPGRSSWQRVRNSAYLSFGRATISGTATVVLLSIIWPLVALWICVISPRFIPFTSSSTSSSSSWPPSLFFSFLFLFFSISSLVPSSIRRSSHSTMSSSLACVLTADTDLYLR